MVEIINKIIKALSNELKNRFDDFHGIYLYGIFTDGKIHEDADMELIAIFDEENKQKREVLWPIVGNIETEFDLYIDLTPTTMKELKKDEDLYEEVMNQGIYFPAE